jgi:dCTP deaminase
VDLSDTDIAQFQRIGMLDVQPWDPRMLQPSSYDLKLGDKYGFPGSDDRWDIPATGYLLGAGEFVLLGTWETVTVGNRVKGRVCGRSSWARRGLQVEAAGLVDPGFTGELTLEVTNLWSEDIWIPWRARIAQIEFMELRSAATNPYGPHRGSHYQGQRDTAGARD